MLIEVQAKKIVIITSGQPSANPRLVKEATALADAGHNITVIYAPISPWADKFDEQLFSTYRNINFIKTGYHRFRNKKGYNWARLRRKIFLALFRKIGDIYDFADYCTSLFGQELLKEVLKHKSDLYIAHNLGALPAAVKAANFHGGKVGFDAEDYHRGEFLKNTLEREITERIENKYLEHLNYLTVSSPLIGESYSTIYPDISPVVINNVFPLCHSPVFEIKSNVNNSLKLFWFSQFIGKNRGLETAIKAIGALQPLPIKLTLLGTITPTLKEYFLNVAKEASLPSNSIHFMEPVQEKDIFRIAATHDIGLGSELVHCENREVCLTNKIFTYILSGLAVVLSDTKAQKKFLDENNDIGFVYTGNNYKSLAEILNRYHNNRSLLNLHRQNAKRIAIERYNWDLEKEKFLYLVQATLAS